MTDQKLIDDILNGGVFMHKAVEWFYHEYYNLIYQKMGTNKMEKDEVQDAYSDSITALVENIRNRRFRGESKCKTYFIRIFHNKCIDIIRKKTTNRIDKNIVSLEDLKNEPMQIAENESEGTNYTEFFSQLSDICREVLMDWSDGFSMDDIADRNGLKNAHTARSKRYNCFRQLIEILKGKNLINEDIILTDGQ